MESNRIHITQLHQMSDEELDFWCEHENEYWREEARAVKRIREQRRELEALHVDQLKLQREVNEFWPNCPN